MEIKGIANFLATLKIEDLMSRIQPGASVKVDLSHAKLVYHSILENLYDFQRTHSDIGGNVVFIGLEKHASSCEHKLAVTLFNDHCVHFLPGFIRIYQLLDLFFFAFKE
ncbi:MAG: hypothetical protein ACI959_001590 [Limisphaerales bacterium]|jgi:hypothetical protein